MISNHLNISNLNSPLKRHRVTRWIKKQDQTIALKTNISSKRKDERLYAKEMAAKRQYRHFHIQRKQSSSQNKGGRYIKTEGQFIKRRHNSD